MTKPLKVFFVYTICLALFIIFGYYFINILENRSWYFINIRIYTIVEYTILSLFFCTLLKNRIVKKILLFCIAPFIIYSVYNYFNTDKNAFSNNPFLVEFLAFIVILAYYFYEKMKIVTSYPLYQSISFWLCVGFFIYFTGNFFFLLFSTSGKDPAFVRQMRILYAVVNISKDIILCLAWLAHEPTEEENAELLIPDDVHLDDEFNFTNKFINS